MIVMKFGGTSVGSALAINNIYKIVKKQFVSNQEIVVFVSAISGVTNLLVSINQEIENLLYRNFKLNEEKDQISKEVKKILTSLHKHFQNEINRLIDFYTVKSQSEIFTLSEFKIDSDLATYVKTNLELTNVLLNIYIRHFELINELLNVLFINSNITIRDKLSSTELNLFFNSILEQLNSLGQKVLSCIKINDITIETQKTILSYGELLSSEIISFYLQVLGLPVLLHNILNDLTYDFIDNKETINFKNKQLVQEKLKAKIILTQGFIARDLKGNITNLGRGGSDYSAALFAAEFDALELQIWTDVSGVKTADPRIVKNAKTIKTININSLNQMAYWGAKVLHPATLIPTLEKNIVVKILNTFDLGNEFTEVKDVNVKKVFNTELNNLEKQNFVSLILKTNTLLVYSNEYMKKSIFSQKSELKELHLIEDINLKSISTSENINFKEVFTIVVISNLLDNNFLQFYTIINKHIQNNEKINVDLFNFDIYQNTILICIDKNTHTLEVIQNFLIQLHNEFELIFKN